MTLLLAAMAAAIPGLAAAVISAVNQSKLRTIHVLVNSKMDEALKTIAGLRNEAAVTALADAGRAQTDREQSATQARQAATDVTQHSKDDPK